MEQSDTTLPTCSTGVTGLDEILRGGLPPNRLYLVRGNPGVGKTTLSIQFLLEGIKQGEKGLYITLSETQDEITGVAVSHGWSLNDISIFELSALAQQLSDESQNTLFHPSEIELNKMTQLLLGHIEKVKPKRVVLDSLSELRLLSDTPLRYRRQILALKQFFAGRNITVLLLDDHAIDGGDLHVQSIAHGVMTIEQNESDYGSDHRRIKVNKLRGVNFLGGFHDAAIIHGGLIVFPRLIASDHHRPYESGQITSDIAEMDILLGGGLDRGTSALLLGPAGTGKSTIAIQYAIATAGRGENAFIYCFEENRRTLLARCESIGLPLQKFIESGRIRLIPIDPTQLAPGEFVHMVKENVLTGKASVVVIDSLNGYLQAMPDVKFLNIQLHELLAFLSHHGVLSIVTVAQHGLVGPMATPIDLTYLADTVVLLRYFEQEGMIKKAISVIKKRIGAHEKTIREFKVDKTGVRVGQPLADFHGVLTGTPTFRGHASQMMSEKS